MNSLLKFIKQPLQEKILLFQVVYYLIVFRIRLVCTPPKILFEEIAQRSSSSLRSHAYTVAPSRIARFIIVASSFVPYSTCLSQALAGSVLFSRNCCNSELHIGVMLNEEQKLEAHAWLSFEGKVFVGNLPNLSQYKELPLKFQQGTL